MTEKTLQECGEIFNKCEFLKTFRNSKRKAVIQELAKNIKEINKYLDWELFMNKEKIFKKKRRK